MLDVDDGVLEGLLRALSDDERQRADALPDAQERRWFVAERGVRRALLAEALGCAPSQVRYEVDAQRRPRLAGGGPRFSTSRSGSVALYAVSESVDVGVDVERIGGDDDELTRLAGRVMSPREHAAWMGVAPAGRAQALGDCWTRKEAHGKALGTGLVFPLSEIDVWAGDDRPVRHGDVHVESVDVRGLARRAGIGGAFAAAIAVRCQAGRPLVVSELSLGRVPAAG